MIYWVSSTRVRWLVVVQVREEEVGSVDLEVGEDMKTMNGGVCKELAAGLAAAVGSVEGSAEGLAVVLVEDLVEE